MKNKISVIYASGMIVIGKGNSNNIGATNFRDVIKKERLDTSVKAIVLRVNSPGGNSIASDIIWREVELASKVKPVVVSMGNYAASGGYYISAPATKIYANPTTLSGSIGVFGLLPNAAKLMEQKLGISTETVNTNENSDFPSLFRPMDVYEKEIMQTSVESVYKDFVNKVASGRNMTPSEVDSIADGHVWGGEISKKLGLVDDIGGLMDAVKGAAALANIESYSVKELPSPEDPYLKLLNRLGGEIRMNILRKELGESFRVYKELMELRELTGVQMRLPYFIEIH
jgi:protease-4